MSDDIFAHTIAAKLRAASNPRSELHGLVVEAACEALHEGGVDPSAQYAVALGSILCGFTGEQTAWCLAREYRIGRMARQFFDGGAPS